MALDFPNSPTIGDEFTGGGFTWVWTGDSWDKVMASVATGGNGFSLIVGATGNTTYAFATPQPAGAYSITSQLGDTTFDIYLVTAANANAGYTNTTALEATAEFDRIVVYGATADDILSFEYKPSTAPATSGDVVDGAAPFLTSATPTTLASIDDTTTVTGGNFASDVEVVFTGQDAVERPAKSIVRSSSTSLIVTRPDAFPVEQEPFTMTATNAGITNPSTNVNKLTDYFDAGSGIVWVTTSPLPSFSTDVAYSTTLVATDADGAGVTYAVTTGSLPTGLSINGSTGEISGTPTATSGTTFTVTATDTGGNSSAREFTLPIAPVAATGGNEVVTVGGYTYHLFTAGGSFAVSANPDSTAIQIAVIGAGGGGGSGLGGGGGAGAKEPASGYASQTLGVGSYTVTVAAGANGAPNEFTKGSTASATSFAGSSTITANGGGGGGSASNLAALGGGSGGGGGTDGGSVGAGGTASGSNTNVGGTGASTSNGGINRGGGGGGATAAGATGAASGNGGQGLALTAIDANLTSANFTTLTGMTVISSGGGGGTFSGGTAGVGGTGAANGGNSGTSPASATSFGSGGGGSGQGSPAEGFARPPGSSGFGGLVIVRYPA